MLNQPYEEGQQAVDIQEAITTAVARAKPYVVHVRTIESGDGDVSALGTGIVFDSQRVLTSAQIVDGSEKRIMVRANNGRKYEATVVGVDPLYFIAVLELDGTLAVDGPPILPVDEAQLGQPVVAIGNALGYDYGATFGVISGIDRTVYRPERFPVDGLLITDARIHPGNAGGALMTLDGRLAALNGIPWQHGLSLAVHADIVWRIVHQMLDYGRATHAWLGFSGEPEQIDRTMVELFNLSFDRGVTVLHVAKNGPGAEAGVQVGDMVVRVRDQAVMNLGTIRRVLSLYQVGETIPIQVLRGSEIVELQMPVREMPRLGE